MGMRGQRNWSQQPPYSPDNLKRAQRHNVIAAAISDTAAKGALADVKTMMATTRRNAQSRSGACAHLDPRCQDLPGAPVVGKMALIAAGRPQ